MYTIVRHNPWLRGTRAWRSSLRAMMRAMPLLGIVGITMVAHSHAGGAMLATAGGLSTRPALEPAVNVYGLNGTISPRTPLYK